MTQMTVEALMDVAFELEIAARDYHGAPDKYLQQELIDARAALRAAIEQYGRERETSGFECGVLAEFKATERQGSSEPADEVMNAAADEIERLTDEYAAATHLLADRDVQIERLTAERDALRVYADRCRWIAAHCRSTAEHWLGRWSIVVEGPPPMRHDDEDAFYAAIDAARAAPKGTT